MSPGDWQNGYARAVMVFLNGDRILEPDQRGRPVYDDSFLLIFNAHYESLDFRLPLAHYGSWWTTVLDTGDPDDFGEHGGDTFGPGDLFTVGSRTLVILRRPRGPAASAVGAAAQTELYEAGTSRGRSAGVPPPTPARRAAALP